MRSDTTSFEHPHSEYVKQTINQSAINLLPFIAFLIGIMMWLVDAYIDATFIHPNETFWDAVFSEESTEMWMRTLVVFVITSSAIVVQYFLRKQYQFEVLLIKYQNHLEGLVQERTRELEHLANIDVLTGIYNRRKGTELLENETERATRYQQPLSLVIFDVDHFKKVNDQYGHSEGDRVLKAIGNLLQQNLRQSDFCARWGGEEFVIVMPHTDLATATSVGKKIKKLIHTITSEEYNQAITASFGVAQLRKDEHSQTLLKRADDALYQAKDSGRDTIILAE